ncbi:MAG: M14 family metallopeptidase [Gemmatimonadetes bacterium]|nr:M14 family metallopeptidase [Gemmatimonadota bacterium]MDA1102333.1 M14 family metallopeptidase [Gemmatimonadota bacterium]
MYAPSRRIPALLLAFALIGTPAVAQETERDLTTIFEIGGFLVDTNGDSVPDLINASLVMGIPATVAEIAAATEISARLGFETMALDLPLARGLTEAIPIVIGRGGLATAALAAPGVDPASLDSGEGAVVIRQIEGRTWVFVIGGDDDGLLAAARLFAGVLPHTRTLSTAHVSRIRDDLSAALEAGGVTGGSIRLTQARARSDRDGIARLIVEVEVADAPGAAVALAFLTEVDGEPSALPEGEVEVPEEGLEEASDTVEARSAPLTYSGLGSVEVRISGGAVLRLPGRATPDQPGPISGRPGSGAKDDLDLSSVYTSDGLLGGSPIPNSVDVILVPGTAGIADLPELGGRLGLESTGLVVPLVQAASSAERPASLPTMVLVGTGNRLTDQLADSGRIDVDGLAPGDGLIELVPNAFGSKSTLVITGADEKGARRALQQVALTFPNLSERGRDRPTVDDVEQELWDALSGHSPVGQAAIGLYKLDRIAETLRDRTLASASVLLSVEKADAGLGPFVAARAAQALGLPSVEVTIDDRDVQNAATIFQESVTFPAEIDRFWAVLRDRVVPQATNGAPIRIEARVSEPPAVRARLEVETRAALIEAGADPTRTEVVVLSAFKQGFSWLNEVIRPQLEGQAIGEIVIRFRRNEPPEDWPQQAINTPVRWLHEIFPIDEVLARDLDIDLERISFEEVREGPTYEALVTDTAGTEILRDTFEPKWVLRPYFDRFEDYEHVRVTTGWIKATSGTRTLADERITTDPEAFWDYFQADVLPALYDHVMELHDGLPRGGSADAPFFGELVVELEMSEPDFRLGIDNEIHAPMDALHEEIYFGTIEFLDVLGRNSRGQGITFPGRILPIMRPKSDGTGARAEIRITGFATSRPAVVVGFETTEGEVGEVRLDIPKTGLERPSARRATVRSGQAGLAHLGLRVRVDTDRDMRDSLIATTSEQQVDERMVSAEQVAQTMTEIEELRSAGLYRSALSYAGLGSMEVWAEWSHEQDPESRRTGTLIANGTPLGLPDWRALVPEDWTYDGERIVQWDSPIPPGEGHEMLGKMSAAFAEATAYRAGRSYLGKDIWAMDLMSPISASHWSPVKASTFKPTVIYSARQHANEVSSTSHVLRHAELLLTDSEQRPKLDKVNVIIHPFTNPDGAQTAYDLHQITPDYILHAGYLGSLGQDATSGGGDDHPIYPESTVRSRLWSTWLPDIFLNPHGYPSHQVVQLFSEYTGLVRRGRVTERNWGFNKGWFMPGFGYVDSPEFPRHKDAAFEIRDYITRGINSNPDVFDLNQRMYAKYERYGAAFDPDVFNLPMTDGVLIEMPLKGSSGEGGGGGGYNPRVTIWSGTTEAPDETAYGPYMELMGKAGLSWDQAITDYLNDGDHDVNRSGTRFFGGVSLRMHRPRPPETDEKKDRPIS